MFEIDIEYTYARTIEFVRVMQGREAILRPLASSNAVAESPEVDLEPAVDGSRPALLHSQRTYPKHPDMPQEDYWALLTLLVKSDAVRRELVIRNRRGEVVADGFEEIWKEDSTRGYRMPYWVDRQLNCDRGAFWRIGKMCAFHVKPSCPQCGKQTFRAKCPVCGKVLRQENKTEKKSEVVQVRVEPSLLAKIKSTGEKESDFMRVAAENELRRREERYS